MIESVTANNSIDESPIKNLIQVVGRTDVGKVRKNNEDNFLIADLGVKVVCEPAQPHEFSINDRGTLLLVSDGMGGRNAGEVASQIIVEVFRNELLNREVKQVGCELLAEITKKANWAIWSRAQRNPQEQGMGATLTALLVEGNHAHIVQVGDSRAYIVRNGRIFRLTKDQSMVQTLIDSGIITPDEAETHPYRHVILQSLGAEPTVYPVTSTIDLYNGDCLLLCSDGLSNMLKDEILQEYLLTIDNLEVCSQQLLNAANENGGKDNITLVLGALNYADPMEIMESAAETISAPPSLLDALNEQEASMEAAETEVPVALSETPTPVAPIAPSVPVVPPSPPSPPSSSPTPSTPSTVEEPLRTEAPGTRERVLVIISDAERRELFESILRRYYEVISASDGEEGLAKSITEHPRMIVASAELDKIPGINLCQALKGNERFRNIPLILVSDIYRDKSYVIDALNSGADDYLITPIDEKELLLRVKPHIEQAKMLETLRYQSAFFEATNIQLQTEMEAVAKTRQDIFQGVLDATSDGILIMDGAGWVTAVNGTFVEFHRVQRENIIGFGYRALLRKIQHIYDNPDQQLQRFTELINNPEIITEDDVRIRIEKRGLNHIKRYSAPVCDENGKIYGRFFVFRNLL